MILVGVVLVGAVLFILLTLLGPVIAHFEGSSRYVREHEDEYLDIAKEYSNMLKYYYSTSMLPKDKKEQEYRKSAKRNKKHRQKRKREKAFQDLL